VSIEWLFRRLESFGDAEAIVQGAQSYSYRTLVSAIEREASFLDAHGVAPGEVVMLEGDFAPRSIALLLCLAHRNAVIAPLAPGAIVGLGADRAVTPRWC
jgi:acyl-CoA synthetase (AMP-forming)/AMP-acid ligase II